MGARAKGERHYCQDGIEAAVVYMHGGVAYENIFGPPNFAVWIDD